MSKMRKAGLAIVMSLVLSLTLLVSGVCAQGISNTQEMASANQHTTTLVASNQSTNQPMLRVSDSPSNKLGNNHKGSARHRVRCYWTWRGWGRWRRHVRVCTRW